MKTTILPTFSRSLTRAMTALLLLTSACDQGGEDLLVDREGVECLPEGEREPTEAQTLAHSKEIVVSDGHNQVMLRVASEDENLIKRYSDATFEIVPVFERPDVPALEEEGHEEERLDAPHDFSESVLIEEASVALEDGAVGYELREVDTGFRDAIWTCSVPNTYTSAADFVRLDVTSDPCTEARISTRLWSWTWYAEKAHDTDQCQGDPSLVGGKRNTNRVKLEVCPGPSHTIAFYN